MRAFVDVAAAGALDRDLAAVWACMTDVPVAKWANRGMLRHES